MIDAIDTVLDLVEHIRDIQIGIILACSQEDFSPYEVLTPQRRDKLSIDNDELKTLIDIYDDASVQLMYLLAERLDDDLSDIDYFAAHLIARKKDVRENLNPVFIQEPNSTELKEIYPFLTNRATILTQHAFYNAQQTSIEYAIQQSNLIKCWCEALYCQTPYHLLHEKSLRPYAGRAQEVVYISDILKDNKFDRNQLELDKNVFFDQPIEEFEPEEQEKLLEMVKDTIGASYGVERHIDDAMTEISYLFEDNKDLYIPRAEQEYIKFVLLDLVKPYLNTDKKPNFNTRHFINAYSELLEHGDTLDGKHKKKSNTSILVLGDLNKNKPKPPAPPTPDA